MRRNQSNDELMIQDDQIDDIDDDDDYDIYDNDDDDDVSTLEGSPTSKETMMKLMIDDNMMTVVIII